MTLTTILRATWEFVLRLLRHTVLAISIACSGCTLIVGGIAAGIPKTVTVAPENAEALIPRGTKVRIGEVSGRFLASHGNAILIETDAEVISLPRNQVGSITLRERGSYATTGIFIGAIMDATLLMLLIAVAASPPDIHGTLDLSMCLPPAR